MLRTTLIGAFMVGLVACSPSETIEPAGSAAPVEAEPAPVEATATAPAATMILLYTLQDGVTPEDFETWVRETDYPGMRGLQRVESFTTYRATGLLPGTGQGEPSVDYIEVFAITDFEGFLAEDMGGDTVQSIMGSFMGFAKAPQFVLVDEVK